MDNSVLENITFANLGEEENDTLYDDACDPDTDPSALSTPRPTSPTFYDPLGLSISQFSPVGNDAFSIDRRIPNGRLEMNLVNAVHMHVQDNARIPNYNHPVDRSNSSTFKLFPRNNYSSESLPEQDNSMAELFLSSESSYRKSLNQTYEVRGVTTDDVNVEKDIGELAAVSVDPTPWSEIKDKIHIEEEREKQRQDQQQVTMPPLVAKTSEQQPPTVTDPHLSNYNPYGRVHQLPIPNQSPQPQIPQKDLSCKRDAAGQEISTMAEALATAAAIARTNGNTNMRGGEPSATPSVQTVNQSKIQVESSHTGQSGSFAGVGKNASSNRHYPRHRGNPNPPPHAAAHAVSRASVLAAANRKTQYGFGGNHIVPSVPAPPSIRSSNQPLLQQKTNRKSKSSPKTAISTMASAQTHTPAGRRPPTVPTGRYAGTFSVEANSGSAYERKKQKAKDARVKLNESIERLAIAVSLAGSQSKLRIDQLENQIDVTEFRQKSIAVNQEGIKLAENAKKWDRPSFVGTAASVIQSLNSQCEALMAELVALQKSLDASKKKGFEETNACNAAKADDTMFTDTIDVTTTAELFSNSNNDEVTLSTGSPNSNQIIKRERQPTNPINKNEISKKRPRLGAEESQNIPGNNEVVLGSVAGMLDPVSLCRCSCTSKLWRGMAAFKDEKTWLNLAVKRFGIYNVRKWSENLKDGECEEISNKDLYEEMNAANVMPHFSQAGLSFLGKGRIKGKLSGWVFVVERSNGETLRSVKRHPRSGTSVGVCYQSRPVVELRIVVQNIGMANEAVFLKSQQIGVDVSTRRKGGELEEIDWDDRFKKVVRNIDGTIRTIPTKFSTTDSMEDICRLELYETALIEVHINARGCSTISKFRQRSNFTKILASIDGTTVPMVIPFPKHDGMI